MVSLTKMFKTEVATEGNEVTEAEDNEVSGAGGRVGVVVDGSCILVDHQDHQRRQPVYKPSLRLFRVRFVNTIFRTQPLQASILSNRVLDC